MHHDMPDMIRRSSVAELLLLETRSSKISRIFLREEKIYYKIVYYTLHLDKSIVRRLVAKQ